MKHTACVGLFAAALSAGALAQQLPKTGVISIHTGWKVTGEALETADKVMQGHGTAIGTAFNDRGSGPLHGGPATCLYTFHFANGTPKNKGFCTFGDADGDRFFTEWNGGPAADGSGTEGVNTILGGTGKYAGIQGNGTWKSRDVGPNGNHLTTQRFEYRLP